MTEQRQLSIWLFPSAYAPHIGGIERVVADLARGLQQANHRAVVVTNRYPHDLPAHEMIDGIEVFRFAWPAPSRNPIQTLGSVGPALRTIRGLRRLPVKPPDIMHVHGLSSQNAYALAARCLFRVPLVLTTHGELASSPYQSGKSSPWSRFWTRRVIAKAGRVVAPSRRAVRDCESAGVSLPLGTTVLPNGIDPAGWNEVPAPPTDSRVVGAWGRLSKEKGFDLLLNVWPTVRSRIPNARLWLAGTGTEEAALQSHLSPGAEMLGPCTKGQLQERIRDTRVVAIPSRYEAFGLVGLEAVATGRTVVYSTCTGLDESVGSAGIAVDASNPHELATALIQALESPLPTERLAVRTNEEMVVDTVDLYETILHRRPE